MHTLRHETCSIIPIIAFWRFKLLPVFFFYSNGRRVGQYIQYYTIRAFEHELIEYIYTQMRAYANSFLSVRIFSSPKNNRDTRKGKRRGMYR